MRFNKFLIIFLGLILMLSVGACGKNGAREQLTPGYPKTYPAPDGE